VKWPEEAFSERGYAREEMVVNCGITILSQA
jgi:hypothetical protein